MKKNIIEFEEEKKENKINKDIFLTNEKLYKKIVKSKDENISGSQILKSIIKDDKKFSAKVEDKFFLIEKFTKKLKFNTKDDQKLTSHFRKKLLKQLSYFEIKTIENYELIEPLNNLWNEYIFETLSKDKKNDQAFMQKFLKSDFHGAKLIVFQSKCKTYEGLHGIVIQETMKTFRIITPWNKIITIVKQNCIFFIEIKSLDISVKLYGCHLSIRPSHRSKIKFKMKDANNFILNSNSKNFLEN